MTPHCSHMFISLANDTGKGNGESRRIINDSYCAPPCREIGWQQLRRQPAATHQFLSKRRPTRKLTLDFQLVFLRCVSHTKDALVARRSAPILYSTLAKYLRYLYSRNLDHHRNIVYICKIYDYGCFNQ